jgi:hypothetical protein
MALLFWAAAWPRANVAAAQPPSSNPLGEGWLGIFGRSHLIKNDQTSDHFDH